MSGGVGAHLCDAAERHGLLVPQLPVEAQSRMKKLFPFASVANPVDCTAQVLQQMDLLTASFETLIAGHRFDAIVAFFSTVPLDSKVAEAVRRNVEEGAARRGECAPLRLHGRLDRHRQELRGVEISCLRGPLSGRQSDRRILRSTSTTTVAHSGAGETADGTILRTGGEGRPDESWSAASTMGLPVALKVESEEIAHKSDVGGVALRLDSEAAVRDAFHSVTTSVRQALPLASVLGGIGEPDGPFGGTIAHGYLTPSLIPTLARSIYRIDNLAMGVNYGAEKVRFPHPVRVGSRIRTKATLVNVRDVSAGAQALITFTVELENVVKPACVANVLFVYAAA